MKKYQTILAAGFLLVSGCTAAQQASVGNVATAAGASPTQVAKATSQFNNAVNQAYQYGQAFCKVDGLATGVVDLAGIAIPALGATQAFVASLCAAVGGIPVPPPAAPTLAPSVQINPAQIVNK